MDLKTKIAILLLFLTTKAGAVAINFGCLTDNDTSGLSCAIAESQMGLEIESMDGGQVLFTFSNTGTIDSFIADVYFMYEGLDFLVFDSILSPDSGVSFSEGARPSHLPGYSRIATSFSAGSDSGGRRRGGKNQSSFFSSPAGFDLVGLQANKGGKNKGKGNNKGGKNKGSASGFSTAPDLGGRKGGRNQNGINQGESLGVLFDLEDATYDDVLAAMLSSDLVIGIHAQGLGERNKYSEGLIMSSPPAVVPLPAAVWLFGSGLLVLFGLLKRSN
jgi:hypothetical protein